MAFSDDLRKLTALWMDSTLIMRLAMITSQFLAFSAIASLSEVVVEWRGFFADGIAFYNNSLIGSVTGGIENIFSLQFSDVQVNVVVFSSLWYLGVIRAQRHDEPHMFTAVDKALPLAVALFLVVASWDATGDQSTGSVVAAILILLFAAIGALQRPGICRLAYFGPVVLFSTVVFLLGAISTGLSAPISNGNF